MTSKLDQWEQQVINEADRVKDLRYNSSMTIQWIDIGSRLPDESTSVLVAWLDIDGETRAQDTPICVHEAEYVNGRFHYGLTGCVMVSQVLMWAEVPSPSVDTLWQIENRKCALEQARLITEPTIDDDIPF